MQQNSVVWVAGKANWYINSLPRRSGFKFINYNDPRNSATLKEYNDMMKRAQERGRWPIAESEVFDVMRALTFSTGMFWSGDRDSIKAINLTSGLSYNIDFSTSTLFLQPTSMASLVAREYIAPVEDSGYLPSGVVLYCFGYHCNEVSGLIKLISRQVKKAQGLISSFMQIASDTSMVDTKMMMLRFNQTEKFVTFLNSHITTSMTESLDAHKLMAKRLKDISKHVAGIDRIYVNKWTAKCSLGTAQMLLELKLHTDQQTTLRLHVEDDRQTFFDAYYDATRNFPLPIDFRMARQAPAFMEMTIAIPVDTTPEALDTLFSTRLGMLVKTKNLEIIKGVV